MRRNPNPLLRVGVATLALCALAATTVTTASAREIAGDATPAAAAKPAHDVTSEVEARRVDSVDVSNVAWRDCSDPAVPALGKLECADVPVPLDYDEPNGEKYTLAVLRRKANNPDTKIGSLFVNPGGPGGSSTRMASRAGRWMDKSLLDAFDIVGVDPRGIGGSYRTRCFDTAEQQKQATGFMYEDYGYPSDAIMTARFMEDAARMGQACSAPQRKINGALSTAEVVRDMDVMRRAVGDKQLTYYGVSYGTAIGQYYANMFPDRIRTMVIDGVVDGPAWSGEGEYAGKLLEERLRSGPGGDRAIREAMKRCDAAGPAVCPAAPNAQRKLDEIYARLHANPVETINPNRPDGPKIRWTRDVFLGELRGPMYGANGAEVASSLVALVWQALVNPQATPAQRDEALREAVEQAGAERAKLRADIADKTTSFMAPVDPAPYIHGYEQFLGVVCSDGIDPKHVFDSSMRALNQRGPGKYTGELWGWGTVPCGEATWKNRDEDAFRGPFNKVTNVPVVVLGNEWDPATNIDNAKKTAARQPNAILIESQSWGHGAWGSSACVDKPVNDYLLTGKLPAKGLYCDGDYQPFSGPRLGADDQRYNPVVPLEAVVKSVLG